MLPRINPSLLQPWSLSLLAALALTGCRGSTTGDGAPGAQGATTAPAQSAPSDPGSSGGTVTPSMPAMGPAMKVSGWVPTWTGQRGDDAVADHTGVAMDEVNPFWYSLEPDGSITGNSGARDAQMMATIRAAGGELIPTVYDVSNGSASRAALTDPARRSRIVQEILAEVLAQDYDGIDIDFESVKSDFKDDFHSFLAELRDALHQHGKLLSIAIPGKRKASPSWTGYDYPAVGPLVDRFKIMTYGYSGPWSSKPGPIAPVTYIRQVLDYAVQHVAREKIYIGIPFYGYDWPDDGSKVRSVTYFTVPSRLAKSSAGASFNATYGESTFTYSEAGVNHTVWFQDDQAIAAKCQLVHDYQVGGIAIWAIGYGGPGFWSEIASARSPQTP